MMREERGREEMSDSKMCRVRGRERERAEHVAVFLPPITTDHFT